MAFATISKQTSTPGTPAAGFARLYFEGTALKYVDETGTVYTLATGISAEDVQDIVGAFFTNTSTIAWNYNDAGNTMTADVVASNVNHNALANYVASQHVDHSTVSITAGTGLTGGGTIAASRTISMPNVGTAGTYGSASSVPVVTTDAQGRVSGVTPTAISVTSAAVSDFTEAAQDAVAGALVDSASIDFTYTDASNQITAAVLPAGVNHDALANFVANEHVDHSAVSISAGTGLTGGGDISTSRTISMPNVGTAGSYGSASTVPVLSTDAQGRVSSVTPTAISIPSTQVSDFAEAVDDRVATLIVAGAGVTATYNDAANTLTISSNSASWTETAISADVTNSSSTTFVTLSGLQMPVVAGRTYRVELQLMYRSAANTAGLRLTINTLDTAAVSAMAVRVGMTNAGDGTGAQYNGTINALNDVVVNTATPVANANYLCEAQGIIVPSASGTLAFQFASEVNGSTVTIAAGSNIAFREFA